MASPLNERQFNRLLRKSDRISEVTDGMDRTATAKVKATTPKPATPQAPTSDIDAQMARLRAGKKL